jgi:hypothetical protein
MKSVLAALLAALACIAQAEAGTVSAADAHEIRGVIERQIEAFRRDDAPGAFALVSPGVRRAFGTPERFLDTVRLAYRAVYRPARFAFLDLVAMGDEVVQPLQITDRHGGVWVAYYAMQRQADGSWKTNGCHLTQPVRTYPA